VFQDRLINDEDRDWFRNLLGDRMKADFNINFPDVVQEPVLYGDFVAQTADKSYQEMDDVTLVSDSQLSSVQIHRIVAFLLLFRR
jgi:dynein heavy chain, axonemal